MNKTERQIDEIISDTYNTLYVNIRGHVSVLNKAHEKIYIVVLNSIWHSITDQIKFSIKESTDT